MVRNIILLFFICIRFTAFSQTDTKAQNGTEKDTSQVHVYKQLFDSYYDLDTEKALEYLEQIKHASDSIGFKKGQEEYYHLKGIYFYEKAQQYDSALYYYKKQLSFEHIATSAKDKIKTYSNIGLAFQGKQQPDSALTYYNRALDLCKQEGCENNLCYLYNNLGLTVFYLGNTERSIEYFEKAYECSLQYEAIESLPNIINNLAGLYSMTGKPGADTWFLNLLETQGNAIRPSLKTTVLLNLGNLYFNAGDLSKSERFLLQAEQLANKQSEATFPELWHGLGNLYFKKQNYLLATKYLKKAESFPDYSHSSLLYNDLAKLYTATGDLVQSQHYYEKVIQQKDSLNNLKIETILQNTKTNIELIKKESELRELQLSNDIIQARQTRSYIILAFTALALLLSVLLAVVFLKKEKSKRKLTEVLVQQKNEKLSEFKATIEQRNTIIKEIEERFKSYKDSKNIQEDLKENILDTFSTFDDWDTFSLYFEDQHKGFYETLKNHCPELTNNDLRLCSLTKLRLSLKETANILNISTDAVKSGRYRVKKKLILSSKEDLSDYLNNI